MKRRITKCLYLAKNNNRVMVLLNATTERSMNHEIIGVFGVGQDITEIDAVRSEKTNICRVNTINRFCQCTLIWHRHHGRK